jgi:hypothetical protein
VACLDKSRLWWLAQDIYPFLGPIRFSHSSGLKDGFIPAIIPRITVCHASTSMAGRETRSLYSLPAVVGTTTSPTFSDHYESKRSPLPLILCPDFVAYSDCICHFSCFLRPDVPPYCVSSPKDAIGIVVWSQNIIIGSCLFMDARDLMFHLAGYPYPCYIRQGIRSTFVIQLLR